MSSATESTDVYNPEKLTVLACTLVGLTELVESMGATKKTHQIALPIFACFIVLTACSRVLTGSVSFVLFRVGVVGAIASLVYYSMFTKEKGFAREWLNIFQSLTEGQFGKAVSQLDSLRKRNRNFQDLIFYNPLTNELVFGEKYSEMILKQATSIATTGQEVNNLQAQGQTVTSVPLLKSPGHGLLLGLKQAMKKEDAPLDNLKNSVLKAQDWMKRYRKWGLYEESFTDDLLKAENMDDFRHTISQLDEPKWLKCMTT